MLDRAVETSKLEVSTSDEVPLVDITESGKLVEVSTSEELVLDESIEEVADGSIESIDVVLGGLGRLAVGELARVSKSPVEFAVDDSVELSPLELSLPGLRGDSVVEMNELSEKGVETAEDEMSVGLSEILELVAIVSRSDEPSDGIVLPESAVLDVGASSNVDVGSDSTVETGALVSGSGVEVSDSGEVPGVCETLEVTVSGRAVSVMSVDVVSET